MTKNNKYDILTRDGFKDFKGLKQSKHKEYVKIDFIDGTNFTCSKDHLVFKDSKEINVLELKEKDIISNKIISKISIVTGKEEIFYDPVGVKDNSSYICSGIDSHNCDEVAFIKNSLWEEFADSVFPAQAALQNSQAILSSTAGGMNHFYSLVKSARKKVSKEFKITDTVKIGDKKFTVTDLLKEKELPKQIETIKEISTGYKVNFNIGTNGYLLSEASWTSVPRFNKDGTPKSNEDFRAETVAQFGELYFEQNFGGCVGYDTLVDIENIGFISIGELYENL